MAVDYGSLPFLEALAFLRAKTNLPTNRWDDLLGNAHDRAFVVAGATAADLLADLRGAVEGSIADGTTLEAFRRQFEDIVHQRGWTGWTGEDTAGGRAWRAQVIYETNLYTSYAAGRHEQMKDVAAARPYWRYRHSHASEKPRAEHLAWDGIILRHDDPWWATHAPPNGFGCKCYIETLAARDLEREGVKVSPRPFDGTYQWENPQTGKLERLPNGVDPGWNYAPGASVYQDQVKLRQELADKVADLNAEWRTATREDPAFRADLAGFADSAGWAEVGGKLIRQATYEGDPNPPVIGRTLWVPKAEWWGDYVRQHETGRLNATKAARAIEKALAGQPLGKAETRLVRWLHDYTQEQHRLEREEAEIYQSLAPKNQALLDRLAYDFIGQVGEAGPSMVSAMADDFAAQNPGAPPEKLNQLLIDELQAWMEG